MVQQARLDELVAVGVPLRGGDEPLVVGLHVDGLDHAAPVALAIAALAARINCGGVSPSSCQ